MFAVPAVMIFINKAGVDMKDPETQAKVKLAFGISQCLVAMSYLLILFIVRSKKDKRKLEVEERDPSTGEKAKKTYTYMGYDFKQTVSKLGTMAVGLCVTCGVYWKWGYVQPLLIQSIMQPLNLTSDPLFKIHFLGSDDSKGDTKRPFKVDKPPGFGMDMAKTLDPKKAEEKKEGKEHKKRVGDEGESSKKAPAEKKTE